jgi:peptidyl-prolyl cis-trans isomerase A (cyclophilin A)
MRSLVLLTIASVGLALSCQKGPAELEPPPKDNATASGGGSTSSSSSSGGSSSSTSSGGAPGVKGPDPHGGNFTLAEATKDLKGNGPIVAKIETTKGTLQCRLFDDKAPVSVANFIGLATGKRAWRDPANGTWVNRPAYDGTTFHRIIKGFMIQGGDPKGNGTGEPGYVIKDEIWDGAKHDRAGLLCMANRGPNTNGAQFFITDAKAEHLDGGYTIFGECAPVEVVHDIAGITVAGERPTTTVTIKSVTISRDEKKK